DEILLSPAGERVNSMGTYSAIGSSAEVRSYVEEFVRHSGADELITVHPSQDIERRLRSIELLASTG
ncbi:MAG: alkane 1-monooxygenase, partial [Deltaproteobacteria bacterium]